MEVCLGGFARASTRGWRPADDDFAMLGGLYARVVAPAAVSTPGP
jgi:hypothetical protein